MENTRVQVLDRALDVIEQLASTEAGLTIAELTARTGLPKSTIHRILSTFVNRDYIDKDSDTSVYSLGQKFVEIASVYLNSISIKTEAQPIMHELATTFSAVSYLGVLDKNEVMYLEKVEQFQNFRFYTQIGKREPLYCTGLGKVLLASLNDENFFHIANQLEFTKWTSNTITSIDQLFKEIKMVRNKGYAIDINEHADNNSCLAVPIYDYTKNVIAAMSVSAPNLLENYNEQVLFAKLKSSSEELSKRMGYTPLQP